MCGRFVSSTPVGVLAAHFGATDVTGDLPSRWNVAPSSEVWVVHDAVAPAHESAPEVIRAIEPMRWGLVPPWAGDPAVGNRLINARAETAATKPSFRAPFRHRRCLIPVDGFYEWAALPGQRAKQPWYFTLPDGAPLGLAGLWEQRRPEDGGVRTCTILTTAADDVVAPVHHRMPVLLPAGAWDTWLDPAIADPAVVAGLLDAVVAPTLVARPVGTAVGNPRNEGPGLVEPVT